MQILDKIEEVPNIAWKIICHIAKNIENNQEKLLMFNERYLHHYFSKEVQNKGIDLNICGGNIMMFPEWPTFKKDRENNFAKYKYEEEKKKYEPKDIKQNKGSSGFIDFAIGTNYNEPEIGIEFKYLTSWKSESVTFDFLKLADKRNPFKVAIWFGLIFRKKGIFSDDISEEKINKNFIEALNRLNDFNSVKERKMYICILEVNNENKKRCFLCKNDSSKSYSFKVSEYIENNMNNYNGFKL
jgi:hypothetical protein